MQEAIEPCYSVEEKSGHLGVSKETIYRGLERRANPANCMVRIVKFKAAEVEQWIRRGEANEND